MKLAGYPEYKDSGVDWLGQVPGHWEIRRLKYMAELAPSKSEVNTIPKERRVSFIPMESIGEDGSVSTAQTREIGEVFQGYTYIAEGDVAIAKITPCFENGKGAVMSDLHNQIGFGTTELIVMRPFAGKLTSNYLYHVVSSREFRVLGEALMYGAGGQKRIPNSFVENFLIAWPPYDEQLQIQRFVLEETARMDALIEEQKKLIELLKEKRQAVISHAVTKGLNPDAPMKDSGVEWLGQVPAHWEVCRLKDGGDLIAGAAFPHKFQNQKDQELPFYKVGDLSLSTDAKFMGLGQHSITREQSSLLRSAILPDGAIIWAKIGAALKLNRRRIVKLPCCIDNNMTAFVPNWRIASSFWAYYWMSQIDFSQYANPGAVPSLSEGYQKFIPFPLPSLDEQKIITDFLESETAQINTLIAESKTGISLLQERRSALISAAVTGKIDVRGWSADRAAQSPVN